MNNGIYKFSDVDINSNSIGGKARNLAILSQNGFPVPDGFVVSTKTFDNNILSKESISIIESLIDNDSLYAVRSSAMVEDAANESWAGQFETYLNVKPKDIIEKIYECHNSKKDRAVSYANGDDVFDIAVVVQKMINAEYAGVVFSKNPVSGEDEIITEYVKGLGEDLVSGKKDPIQVIINDKLEKEDIPFDILKLKEYVKKIVKVYNDIPQDIEYAISNNNIYILQSRPITTNKEKDEEIIELGSPEEIFYWGPSKAESIYMSDFFAGMEDFFNMLNNNKDMPKPPVTLCLFSNHQMVWLNRMDIFGSFVKKVFLYYEKNIDIDEDYKKWTELKDKKDLVKAFNQTEFAEFALYGAETEIFERLKRFDDKTKRDILTAFATPEDETFLNRLDRELVEINDYKKMAKLYPWICDGYGGVKNINAAEDYFKERSRVLNGKIADKVDYTKKRNELLNKYDLSNTELKSLELLKKLVKYMDDRKEWMMSSRKDINKNLSNIEYGWYYDGKVSKYLTNEETDKLFDRYVMFQSATGVLKGMVASSGNYHFVSGEVVVIDDSTKQVDEDKILVCPMTSPSYVPLMRKAKALVTDHGGAMSHAAIVAREFGLPAIVGTKTATKVLKTGDKVMLNLLTGEIIK
ncbi:MAG: hypothetical protein IK137_00230 [Bacilli bacterium]|nr:hypothetical protein [Bacilli bacterium]